MIQSLNLSKLISFVSKQISNLFPDCETKESHLDFFIKKAIKRVEYCFSKINIKYFNDGKNIYFNHLNSDQYASFLYYLSNTIWEESKDEKLASKVYYLNKALHAVDIFYEVELPDIFLLTHPVGTVLGRGKYSNYFVAYQRVTVGSNMKSEYPTIGKGVAMYGGSALIGNCVVSNNCLISIGTIVMDTNIPPEMVVFGKYPDIKWKKTKKSVIERYFFN